MMAIREPAGKFKSESAPAILRIEKPASSQVWAIGFPAMGSERNT